MLFRSNTVTASCGGFPTGLITSVSVKFGVSGGADGTLCYSRNLVTIVKTAVAGCSNFRLEAGAKDARKAKPILVGLGTGKSANGKLSGKLTRFRTGIAGVYQTVVIVRSATDPKKFSVLRLRPVVLPPSKLVVKAAATKKKK